MDTINERIESIKHTIAKSAKVFGTSAEDIDIVAVTKTVSPDIIQKAVDEGIHLVGENRVQEAQRKIEKVQGDFKWHLIGHLQRNKAKPAIDCFSIIQSLDSYELALSLDKAAQNIKTTVNVLVQVNIGLEDTKYGINPSEITDFVTRAAKLPNLKIKGLMSIPPFMEDPEKVRPFFKNMRQIFDDIKNRNIENVEMKHLSMGMTHDFAVAVQEGSNMVRIGTGIFGKRD